LADLLVKFMQKGSRTLKKMKSSYAMASRMTMMTKKMTKMMMPTSMQTLSSTA